MDKPDAQIIPLTFLDDEDFGPLDPGSSLPCRPIDAGASPRGKLRRGKHSSAV
jgi:hypothetical protein